MMAGRFVLLHGPDLGYVTSWDTWDEAIAAFQDGRMPDGFRLEDGETGRVWKPGAAYEWEAAAT